MAKHGSEFRFFRGDGVQVLEVDDHLQPGTLAVSFGDGVSLGAMPWRLEQVAGLGRSSAQRSLILPDAQVQPNRIALDDRRHIGDRNLHRAGRLNTQLRSASWISSPGPRWASGALTMTTTAKRRLSGVCT